MLIRFRLQFSFLAATSSSRNDLVSSLVRPLVSNHFSKSAQGWLMLVQGSQGWSRIVKEGQRWLKMVKDDQGWSGWSRIAKDSQ